MIRQMSHSTEVYNETQSTCLCFVGGGEAAAGDGGDAAPMQSGTAGSVETEPQAAEPSADDVMAWANGLGIN